VEESMRAKLGIAAAALALVAGCGGDDDGADVRDIGGTTTGSTGSGTGTGTGSGTGTETGTTTDGTTTDAETETEAETTTTG
jgi:hypothetical protein